jgi:hypothetical protein
VKFEITSDAIVTFDDALKWAEVLLMEPSQEVINRALTMEPAAFGVGAQIAKRTCDRLRRKGVPEPIIAYVFNQICSATGLTIEMMRMGTAQLWQDVIEPADDTVEGNAHE